MEGATPQNGHDRREIALVAPVCPIEARLPSPRKRIRRRNRADRKNPATRSRRLLRRRRPNYEFSNSRSRNGKTRDSSWAGSGKLNLPSRPEPPWQIRQSPQPERVSPRIERKSPRSLRISPRPVGRGARTERELPLFVGPKEFTQPPSPHHVEVIVAFRAADRRSRMPIPADHIVRRNR